MEPQFNLFPSEAQNVNNTLKAPETKKTGSRNVKHIKEACIFCNRRHIKCNGENPCNQCISRNQQCTYTIPQKRIRKIPEHANTQKEEFWLSKYKDSQKQIDEIKLALIKANQHLPVTLPATKIISLDHGLVYLNKFIQTVLPVFPTINVTTIDEKFLRPSFVANNLDDLCEAFESSVALSHGAFGVRSIEAGRFLANQAQQYYLRIQDIVDEGRNLVYSNDIPQKLVDSVVLLEYVWQTDGTTTGTPAPAAKRVNMTAAKLYEKNKDKVAPSMAKRLFAALATYAGSPGEKNLYLEKAQLETIYFDKYQGKAFHDIILLAGAFAASLFEMNPNPVSFDMHYKVLSALEQGETLMEQASPEEFKPVPKSFLYFCLWSIRCFLYHRVGKVETATYWLNRALPLFPTESLIADKLFYGTLDVMVLLLTVVEDKVTFDSIARKLDSYGTGKFLNFDRIYGSIKKKCTKTYFDSLKGIASEAGAVPVKIIEQTQTQEESSTVIQEEINVIPILEHTNQQFQIQNQNTTQPFEQNRFSNFSPQIPYILNTTNINTTNSNQANTTSQMFDSNQKNYTTSSEYVINSYPTVPVLQFSSNFSLPQQNIVGLEHLLPDKNTNKPFE